MGRGLVRHLCNAVMAALAIAIAVPLAPSLHAAPPPLSTYGSLPGVERAAISPSGDHVAMVGMVDGVRRLLVLNQDKKSAISYPLNDTKVRGIYWAGDERVLLHTSNTSKLVPGFIGDKIELFSMVVIPLNGEKNWSVFANNERITGGVARFHGIQQRDGRYYGYFEGLTFKGDFRSPDGYLTNGGPVLYEVDLQNQRATPIAPRFEGGGGYRDWLIGPDGKVGATLDYTSTTGNWAIRNSTGQKVATGTNPLGRIELVGVGTTPGATIYSEEVKETAVRWFETSQTGDAPKEILAGVAIADTFFDAQTRQFIGYREEGDVPAYRFFDTKQQKVVNATLKAFPGLIVHIKSWNDQFDRLIVMTDGADDPQTWWMVDIRSGKAQELGVSYPLGPNDIGPVRIIKYKAGDGMDMEGVLTLPPGRQARNLPVILLPHGGPASRDYPGFDWWAQAFASRGYAVFQPNFRGSTGYGLAFQRAGNGQWGRKMQSDISDSLAYLASEAIVDPKRACIMGASYGGYAALAGVTLQHGLYRCAVAVAGVSDVAKMASTDIIGSNYDKSVKRAIEAEIGTRDDLRPVSPINFASNADAPVLLIHGLDDIVVPYDQSNTMARALRAAGKSVELVTLPGEDHWLSRSETRLAMLEAAVRFITTHNPPDPAPQ